MRDGPYKSWLAERRLAQPEMAEAAAAAPGESEPAKLGKLRRRQRRLAGRRQGCLMEYESYLLDVVVDKISLFPASAIDVDKQAVP